MTLLMPHDPRRWQTITTAIILIGLSITELIAVYRPAPWNENAGAFAFVALCVALAGRTNLRENLLLVIAATTGIALAFSKHGPGALLAPLGNAAFFAAFIYLVTLLKEAALRSASVLEIGTFMTRQPPGRRYYCLAFGGHMLGVLLNFGSISLLVPLIQRGARANRNSEEAAILERQQISALVRGFSWILLWSPTALTQVVILNAFPEVNHGLAFALGIASVILLVLIGRMEEAWYWSRHSRWSERAAPEPAAAMPWPSAAGRRFGLLCTSLIALTLLVMWIAGVSAAIGLMLVAPLVMVAWIVAQQWRLKTRRMLNASVAILGEIALVSTPSLARIAVTLGLAGFIGQAAALLAPVETISSYINWLGIKDWQLLMLLPVVIVGFGQIAISPLVVVVFLASVLNQLPMLPADPTLIAYALAGGWALSMTLSPNASATLLISGVSGIAPTVLTWKWNARYGLICYAVLCLVFVGLSTVLPA